MCFYDIMYLIVETSAICHYRSWVITITIIDNNPVVRILTGLVTYADLAAETGLSTSTCRRVLHVPTACFNDETAEIVAHWVRMNLGPVATEELFCTANLTTTGAKPLTAQQRAAQKSPKAVCGDCFMEALPSGHCSECGQLLVFATSA